MENGWDQEKTNREVGITPPTYVPGMTRMGGAVLLQLHDRARDVKGIEAVLAEHDNVFPDVDDFDDLYAFAPIEESTVWHCSCGEETGTTVDVDAAFRHHLASAVSAWLLRGL